MRQSTPALVPPQRRTRIEMVTSWRKVFPGGATASAGADGSAVADPYGATGWATNGLSIEEDGRVLLCGRQGGRIETLGLFTTTGANLDFQVFGFDWVSPSALTTGGATAEKQNLLKYPDSNDLNTALGVPYSLSRDDAGNPQTLNIAAGAETVSLSYAGAVPYRPSSGGTTYYVGPRHIFDTSGLYAFWFWVTAVSSGSATLLARTV